MRLWYRVRSQLAEVIRVCTEQRSLTGCQARSARAQRHHIMCAWRHFVCWSRNDMIGNSVSTNSSSSLSFQGRSLALPTLERLQRTA